METLIRLPAAFRRQAVLRHRLQRRTHFSHCSGKRRVAAHAAAAGSIRPRNSNKSRTKR